jgi:hypothetical protein
MRVFSVFFISIFKRENRRASADRRNPDCGGSSAHEKRRSDGRRTIADRRNDTGRRTGMYYKLPDNQKYTLDTIINILEKQLKK